MDFLPSYFFLKRKIRLGRSFEPQSVKVRNFKKNTPRRDAGWEWIKQTYQAAIMKALVVGLCDDA